MDGDDFVPPRDLDDDDLMWADDFDPDTSPPDGDEAWLNDLPYELREEYLVDPWTGAGEVSAAGFEHKAVRRAEPGRAGYGFAAGGVLDRLTPGPTLAGFVADALADAPATPGSAAGNGTSGTADSAVGSDGCSDAGSDASGGAESSGGADGSGGTNDTGGGSGLGESELVGVLCASRRLASLAAAQEITAVITLARRRAAQARELRNPHLIKHLADEVAAALTLTSRAADRLITIAAALDRLPAVLAALAAGIIDWPRAVVFADELAALDDADARAIADRLLPRAEDMTTGQLRAALRREVLKVDPEAAERRRRAARKDAGVHLWDETSGNAAIAGRELPPADVIAADKQITAHAQWLKSHGAEGTMDQLRAAVFTALLAGRPVSGLLPGADETGAASRSSHSSSLGSVGLGSGGSGSASSDGGGSGGASPAGMSPDPAPAGITGTVNLTMPLASWLDMSQAPGEVPGFGALDAGSCRDLAGWLAAHPATQWCLTLTDQNGAAVGHACARHGPDPPRPAPGTGSGQLRWLAGLRPLRLESGECTHQRQVPGYRPPRSMRHLITIRQQTCGAPGCRRPAVNCDLDHATPYDQGGRTCECNLHPVCRRHHQAKQAPGWHLHQPEPGVLVWTLPSGRSYTTRPDPYPT